MTVKELSSSIKNMAKIANKKLKDLRAKGYENYNQSMIKKFNLLTDNSENPDLVTKRNLFRTGTSHFTKEQLERRLDVLTEFVNNKYASAEWTEKHLKSLRDKWGVSEDEKIKQLFDLYREYGYDNYKDSNSILTAMSEIIEDYDHEMLNNILDTISLSLDNQGKNEDDYVSQLQNGATFLRNWSDMSNSIHGGE